jgi:hypothetical protein
VVSMIAAFVCFCLECQKQLKVAKIALLSLSSSINTFFAEIFVDIMQIQYKIKLTEHEGTMNRKTYAN